MIRRLFVPLLGSGLLLGATATMAMAKCEGPNPPEFCQQVVAFIQDGTSLTAGTAATVDVWIQKGEQPYAVKSVTLQFYRFEDASIVRAPATLTSQPGVWSAEVTLPAGGGWRAEAYVTDLDGVLTTMAIQSTIVVRVPVKPPVQTPTTPPPATPATPTLPALPIALLVAGLAAAAMAGMGLRDRARRRTGALASNASTAE